MHNSHWIGQIFGFKYRSASSNWNINKGSLWEPNVHKSRIEGKRKKEVFKGWARATKTTEAICLFALAWEGSKASPDHLIPVSENDMFKLFLFDSEVEFIICYKCTMKLSNRNSPAPGTQLYLKRALGWSLFVTSLYCPSWPPDHTRVSFTDWKTLLGPEKVLVTSCAPMPIITHPWHCSAHPDRCSPKSMFATLTAHL